MKEISPCQMWNFHLEGDATFPYDMRRRRGRETWDMEENEVPITMSNQPYWSRRTINRESMRPCIVAAPYIRELPRRMIFAISLKCP